MDLQKMVDNAVQAQRASEMLTSEQLTLGELVLKLEALPNKELPIVFDEGEYKPTGLGSWRGSYRELAIQYEDGGGTAYEQPKPDCLMDEPPFGRDHSYKCPCGGSTEHNTTLSENPTAQEFLDVLKLAQGKYFVGYKGGDFTMGKTTPIWVANYGTSSGFKTGENYGSQAVVDVVEDSGTVRIITNVMDY